MKFTSRRMCIALLGLVLPCAAFAQSDFADGRAGHWYIGGGFGGFSAKDNSQLNDQDSKAAIFFSGGYRASPFVSIEADLLGWQQDFATPASIAPGILSSAQARTDLTTTGVAAVIKFYLPVRAVDLYAGGGLGFYTSNINVEGTGAAAGREIDTTETDLGYQLQLGADIYVARRLSIGLEYRWLQVDTDFAPYIAGKIDVGGQFFLMNVRGSF